MSVADVQRSMKAISTAESARSNASGSEQSLNVQTDAADASNLKLPLSDASLPDHPTQKFHEVGRSSVTRTKRPTADLVTMQVAKEGQQSKAVDSKVIKDIAVSQSSIVALPAQTRAIPTHMRTKEAMESTGNVDCVNCFCMFSNGEFASGSGDGRILIWNEGTGEVIQILQNHEGPVLAIATNHDERSLISGSADMSMKKWNLTQPVIAQDMEYRGHTRWVQSVAAHQQFVFSASLDKSVRQWDLISGKCNFIFAGHPDWVSSLCVHASTLYTGSWDGIIRLWNIDTWECTHLFEGHSGPILAICLDVKHAADVATFIYSASQDGCVKSWCLNNHIQGFTYSGHVLGVSAVNCSKSYVASGSFDSTIRLYKCSVAEPVHVLHGHEDSVTCVKLSKDDLHLYSSSDDYTIRKWDCSSGVCLRVYGIPRSQQIIESLGSGGRKGGSLSLLLNFGDDEDPTSLRSRVRKILREEENENILLEHEFSRRIELYRSRSIADHLEANRLEHNSASAEHGVFSKSPFEDPAFEDSVLKDLKDDFQNQRCELIAVYSDAKESLREEVLDCAGLGASAIPLLWENKQESLKVAWLECQKGSCSIASASNVVQVEPVADSSPQSVSCESPEQAVFFILQGILDAVCQSDVVAPADVPGVANVPLKKGHRKSVFDATSASIDVADVSLLSVISPQLMACLDSILHRANRRFLRAKSSFSTKFFESVMMQADDRDRRSHVLQTTTLDTEERKMLLQQEESRLLALISAEAREMHAILTQVTSEIDRLVLDYRQLWILKFSGAFTEHQWSQIDCILAELISKYQLASNELYEEFDKFSSEATSKELPLSDFEQRCEQVNSQMASLQQRLDEDITQALTAFDFMTAELLSQFRSVFGRDATSVMLQFRMEVGRQKQQSIDEALERARQEDNRRAEAARLDAKRAFKEKMQRDMESAKLSRIEKVKAATAAREKSKVSFELALANSSEDFSDLESSCFVFVHRCDLRKRPVLIIKMANFPSDPCLEGRPIFEDFEAPSEDWQWRLSRFIMLKLDSILSTPGSTHDNASRYLLVVDFSNSSPSRRPSILFLQQAWFVLPDRARALIDECVIIECHFWFRAFVWFIKPLVSPRVWKKVRFIKQFHDLWGLLSHVDLAAIASTDSKGNSHRAFSDEASGLSAPNKKISFLSLLSKARTAHLIRGHDSPDFFHNYFEIINGAKVADWTDIADLHFLDTSSVDLVGRPVIMFIASNFPCKLGDSFLNRCLVFIMLKVHELMFEQKKLVSILVLCSNITTQNIPSASWLQMAVKKFPYVIRKKIQSIYLLNAGFLVKKVLWVLRSIVSTKVAAKLVEVDTIIQLMRYFNHAELKLPPSVLQDVPFGGTPEEMQLMMADIRAAMQRGQDAGFQQKVDLFKQFKLGSAAPSDCDIESCVTVVQKEFEGVNGSDIIQYAGRDLAARPTLSIVMANIPANKGEIIMNKVFRLIITLVQSLSQHPVAIALIASHFSPANQPNMDWMKDVHKSIDSAARKNLRAVYVFEPTFLVKSLTYGLQSFVSVKFFKKIHLITDPDDFHQHFDVHNCKLPQSLIGRYLRVPSGPVVQAALPCSALPPEFASLSPHLFAELQARKASDFGADFDDFAKLSGSDVFSNAVIVIDSSKMDSSSLEAFVARVMFLLALAKENISHNDTFSVVYCDSPRDGSVPSTEWLRGAYALVPKHLRKNIKQLYCVNSSQSLKMFFWLANTFVSSKFSHKVVHIMDTADLAEYLNSRETQLPQSALEHLPQADANKMSLAMVRRSRALMNHQLSSSSTDAPASSDFTVSEAVRADLSCHNIIEAAHAANKTAASNLECMYLSTTLQGFPCVMIRACKLPSQQHAEYDSVMRAMFLLLVVFIDSVSKYRDDSKYCLLLSTADSTSENRPSMEWIRAFHAQLPHAMRKNCSNVFIYLPSLALRAILGTSRLFLSSKFFKKIVSLNSDSDAALYFDISEEPFVTVAGKGAAVSPSAASSTLLSTTRSSESLASNTDSSINSTKSQALQEQPLAPALLASMPPAQHLVTRFRNVNGKPVLRCAVPLGQVPWASPYAAYSPPAFTSEGYSGSVRSSIRSPKNPLGEADPEDVHEVIHGLRASVFDELRESEESIQCVGLAASISSTALGKSRRLRFSYSGKLSRNDNGYPLNPAGRTGLCGRANHLLWGPNHRALPVIVRCSGRVGEQHLQLLLTKDYSTNSQCWSLPESAVPAGHSISPQLLKELEDLVLSHVDVFDDSSKAEVRSQFQQLFGAGCAAPDDVLHAGLWDECGSTDHAWSEALCVLVLLEDKLAAALDGGTQDASWVPYDPSIPMKQSHLPLLHKAILRLCQRGVCDAHGNMSPGFGGFSFSSSLAVLEKTVASLFSMDAFPEGDIHLAQENYEQLEKSDGLYAESTVAARRSLAVRYRKLGNSRAAKALEALDKSDILGGAQSSPKSDDPFGSGLSSPINLSADVSRDTLVSQQDGFIDSMLRLYQTRVDTLGLHDPLTISLRKQLYKELNLAGRSDEAHRLRSEAMSYNFD